MTTTPPFAIDKPAIMERLGGDREIYAMMIDIFLQDVEHNCSNLLAASLSGSAELLVREAHTVKGLLATMSDDHGAELALALEMQARQGVMDGAEAKAQGIVARINEVAAVLRVSER
ncbi:MAG TPA: Hpt domain-containing protein [Azonexus sp.]|nr:Hpt domain-containing protein [Azonexus sp.]